MRKRVRSVVADALVVGAVLLGGFWVLRGVTRALYRGLATVVVIVVLVLMVRTASKLRR